MTRVRLLLTKHIGDDSPVVVAGVDGTIWEHWDDEDEATWIEDAKRMFGAPPEDYEWRQAWAVFPEEGLTKVFGTVSVRGDVVDDD